MATNPFEVLLTPDALRARREADFANRTKGLDYWTRQAAEAGFGLRQSLREQGRGLSPEDKKAAKTEAILGNSQRMLAEMVKSGEVDPLDAQEAALTQAMSEFMQDGDFAAAASFLPAISGIRKQKEELSKLKSETGENQAQAYQAMTTGELRIKQAEAAVEQGMAHKAQVRLRDAQAEAALAQARLRDRTDPNLRKGGGTGGGSNFGNRYNKSFRQEVLQTTVGASDLFDKLGKLSDLYFQSPAVRAAATGVQTSVQEYTRGFAEYVRQVGMSSGGRTEIESNANDLRVYNANKARILRTARDLKIDAALAESLVIDLAFALARANDPGGRLSNNDFDFSLRMLGALQDPRSAQAVFKQIAGNIYNKNSTLAQSDPALREDLPDAFQTMDDRYNEFINRFQSPQTVTPDADGWQQYGPDTRVREIK